MTLNSTSVAIIGGCGHVGLPLAVTLASNGFDVTSFDTKIQSVESVNSGNPPFFEPGLESLLRSSIASGKFRATDDVSIIQECKIVIVVIGTPVDEHLNPDPVSIRKLFEDLQPYLKHGQLVILRSTIYPGVTRMIEEYLVSIGLEIHVAFCPERIAEGHALEELRTLPQLVGARTEISQQLASEFFSTISTSIITTSPEEAELAKLFTNTWRYIKFAAANQLFMMSNDFGVDFEQVRRAITTDYPRAADMPGPGFAAGPCLFKDTMQLAAFNNNQFTLGHASMLVNEGLPLYVVSRVEKRHDLRHMTVGILGMAFKGESDDTRSSLAYKLKHVLEYRAGKVICADSNVVTDSSLVLESELLSSADIVFIGAPHMRYRTMYFNSPVIDIWNVLGSGVLI